MAMSGQDRRVALVSALALLAGACAGDQGKAVNTPVLRQAQRRPGHDVVLVVMPPPSDSTQDVWTALLDELGEDFDVVAQVTDDKTMDEELATVIAETDAVCIVLIDNTSLRLYEAVQSKASSTAKFPPSLVLLSSFLDQRQLQRVRRASGIAYEVPAVTAVMNLRSFLSRPIDRVGVVHRARQATFVEQQQTLAEVEHVKLIPRVIVDDPSPQDVRTALDELVNTARVDALWLLNDNHLLSKNLIQQAWLPILKRADIPAIVGVRALVSSEVTFGTFAMAPDHTALGVQAADLVYELLEEGSNEQRVDLPVSVKIAVDVKQARRNFGLKPEMLERIDYLVE